MSSSGERVLAVLGGLVAAAIVFAVGFGVFTQMV